MQLIDLMAQQRRIAPQLEQAIQQVLQSGQFIGGEQVAQLEQALGAYTGRREVITCASGTDALQLWMMAMGLTKGEAVFVPAVTFIASAEPALLLGAQVVFCDVSPSDFTLSPQSLRQQIERVKREGRYRPRMVVLVDFLGNPGKMQEIQEICQEEGLLLLEDAAQAFGAVCQGKPCGSWGEGAVTSFFPAKPLGCYGDGGAVFTDDPKVAEICRSLAVHGKGPQGKYASVRVGINSRLDTLQAAILQVKLKILPEELWQRQEVADRYHTAFEGLFARPAVMEGNQCVYAQYALLAEDEAQRQVILRTLEEWGIPSMIYYPAPLPALPVFQGLDSAKQAFPVAEDYCRRTFSLPMHPYLTKEEQNRVICGVKEGLRRAKGGVMA